MSKHTPGPWTFVPRPPSQKLHQRLVGPNGETIVVFKTDVVEPNARVIAAAPTVLQALQWLYAICLQEQLLPEKLSYMVEAEKAIALALKGESNGKQE